MYKKYNLGHKFDNAARVMAVMGGFGLSISTSLSVLGFSLMIIFWIAGANYPEKLDLIRQNRNALFAAALFGLFIVGTIYSTTTWKESMAVLMKYRELIYIPILVSLFGSKLWKERAINWFLYGMIILLVASYAQYFGLLGYKGYTPGLGVVFLNRIGHSIFDAFFIFILATKFFSTDDMKIKLLYTFGGVATLVNLVFMVNGQTGYLIFLVLVPVFLLLRYKKKSLVPIFILLPAVIFSAYFGSEKIRDRVHETVNGIHAYQAGKLDNSPAVRLTWLKRSLEIMSKHPVFGTGTGSFRKEFERSGSKHYAGITNYNPHNVYLGIGVQLGATGLIIFFLLLYFQFRLILKLQDDYRFIALGAWVSFVIAGSLNPMLFDGGGQFFAYFMGIFLATSQSRIKEDRKLQED